MNVPQSKGYRILCDRVFDPLTQSFEARRIEVRDGFVVSSKPLVEGSMSAEGVEIFDLRGFVLLPPLIDAHVHAYMNPWPLNPNHRSLPGSKTFHAEFSDACERLRQAFLMGVGGMRDLGDPMELNLAAVERAALDSGMPRLIASGPGLYREGRYGRFIGRPFNGLSSLLSEIRKLAADPRVHLIKLVPTGIINFKKGLVTAAPQFSLDELKAAVDLAHELGKKTAAHCSGDPGIRLAAEAGVDFIEHGYFASRETMDLIAGNRLAWTPTLAPVHVQWNHSACCGWDEETRSHLRRILEQHAEMVRYARSMGAQILAGSDAGGVGVSHGGGLHLELRLLQEAGIPTTELLGAATVGAAQRLGFKSGVGMLNDGTSADFIVVDAPIDRDVRHLDRIRWVARDGRIQKAVRSRMESDANAETFGITENKKSSSPLPQEALRHA